VTHPTLDFMNTYGMRWLMPFVNKWFYADGLFIVDIWIIIALGAGVYAAKRTGRTAPARVAIGFLAAYTICALGVTEIARRAVEAHQPGTRFMVGPVPLLPWRRDVLLDDGAGYRRGTWSPGRGVELGPSAPKGDNQPAVAAARQDRDVQRYLVWARFPSYMVSRDSAGGTVVRIVDERYGSDWASITVRLP
jgi:inner membrane protein